VLVLRSSPLLIQPSAVAAPFKNVSYVLLYKICYELTTENITTFSFLKYE